jgi:hypothetical protein
MSECFLEGFVVSPASLTKLVGTPAIDAKSIRKKLAKRGKALVDAALDTLARGKPTPESSA